jgi:hypothetical protein
MKLAYEVLTERNTAKVSVNEDAQWMAEHGATLASLNR